MTDILRATHSPDEWSVLVTPANVGDLPLGHGFYVPAIRHIIRPTGIMAGVSGVQEVPYMQGVDEYGSPHALMIRWVPNMERFADRRPTVHVPLGCLATLRHTKGGALEPEPLLRVLRLTAEDPLSGHPATVIRYGEHPEHPGQTGFYLGAEHVGVSGIQGIGLETEYLPEPAVAVKYFPLEPRQP